MKRYFSEALATLPDGTHGAIVSINESDVSIRASFPVAGDKPKAPRGSMGATGLFTNHDYLTDTLFAYFLAVNAWGEDSPQAMVIEASLKNIARWLAAMPVEALDVQHGQSLPALAAVGILFDDRTVLRAFYRWAATLPNNPMLSTRTGMTTRAWFRFPAQLVRAARVLARIRDRGLDPSLGSEDIDVPRIVAAAGERLPMALDAWAVDRATPGKKGEDGRGFIFDLDAPWNITSPGRAKWPYWSGDADFIGFHDQPFMYSAVLGHTVAWLLAEEFHPTRATLIRFRELSTWALWAFYDPVTNTALEAVTRGTFRPTARHARPGEVSIPATKLPFSEWGALERSLEGALHHSLAGTVLGANAKRAPRARLLRRMLGTIERPADAWIQRMEIDSPTVFALAFLERSTMFGASSRASLGLDDDPTIVEGVEEPEDVPMDPETEVVEDPIPPGAPERGGQ